MDFVGHADATAGIGQGSHNLQDKNVPQHYTVVNPSRP